jgi:hypothetical protein
MNRTTSSESAEVRLLDRPLDIQDAGWDVAGTAAPLTRDREQAVRPVDGGGIFVTPDGAWLREGSDEFFVVLGDPDPDYDAPLFAIKNLGFIFVQVVAAPLVDITLHPRNVAPAALRSLQQWLQSFQFSSFKLNYMKDRWISEILTTPAQVICRLFEISALEMIEDASYFEPSVASNITARQIGFGSTAH